jgi:hypothetical protein
MTDKPKPPAEVPVSPATELDEPVATGSVHECHTPPAAPPAPSQTIELGELRELRETMERFIFMLPLNVEPEDTINATDEKVIRLRADLLKKLMSLLASFAARVRLEEARWWHEQIHWHPSEVCNAFVEPREPKCQRIVELERAAQDKEHK